MLDSTAILQFAPVTNNSSWFTQPSMMYLGEPNLIGVFHSLVAFYFHGREVLGQLSNLNVSAVPLEHQAVVNEFIGSAYPFMFVVDSVLSHSVYMMGVGALWRLHDLITQSAIKRVYGLNWHRNVKLLASFALPICSDLIMGALGYSAQELCFMQISTVIATYLLPYLFSNMLREVEVLSPTRNFHPLDFVARNSLYALRNFSSTLFIDHILPVILYGFKGLGSVTKEWKLYQQEIPGVFVRPVPYLKKPDGMDVYAPHLMSSDAIYWHRIFLDEAGFTLGKMLVDLLLIRLARFGLIEDIRDPFKRVAERIVKGYKSPGARIAVELAKREAAHDKRAQQIEAARMVGPAPTNSGSSATDTRDPVGEMVYVHQYNSDSKTTPSKKNNKSKGKKNNKSKGNNVDIKEEGREVASSAASPKADNRREFIPDNDNKANFVVPLTGSRIKGNVWGVITDTTVPNFRLFETSLQSGVVSDGSGIKYLDKGGRTKTPIFELKCSLDARLLGKWVQGEDDLYLALKGSFGIDKAQAIIDKVSASGESPAIICFEQLVRRHEEIGRSLAVM
jgi:hypothetical protein